MSPRTKSSTMSRRRASAQGSMATEARWLPRTSSESVEIANAYAHDMSPLNPVWSAGSVLRFAGHDNYDYDTVTMEPFPIEDASYMMPVLSNVADSFGVPMHYPAIPHGSMSQTLTAPYYGTSMEEDILRPAPTETDYHSYHHISSASFRHGLPSPPADIITPQAPNFPADVIFTGLPDSVLTVNMSYKNMSPSSPPKEYHPRPIRSALERDVIDHANTLGQEFSYLHDDRADKVKARNDPRYDQGPDKNGFYHCPLIGDGSCTHKPTKQKCIFAKYLDSHLKPYLCKHGYGKDCEGLRFSSNACLFRHEREAHGLHNHGLNPYLCFFRGCERARQDNGFPRRWNQRDHMKRVHDWVDADDNDNDAAPFSGRMTETTRRRKTSGSSNGVAMKRTSSSHSKAATAKPGAEARHARGIEQHHASMSRREQTRDMRDHSIILGDGPYPSGFEYQYSSQISDYPGNPYTQMVY